MKVKRFQVSGFRPEGPKCWNPDSTEGSPEAVAAQVKFTQIQDEPQNAVTGRSMRSRPSKPKVIYLSGKPTNYRQPLFRILGKSERLAFHFAFFSRMVPDRTYEDHGPMDYPHCFLAPGVSGIRRLLNQERPDGLVVHAHWPWPFMAAGLTASLMGIPIFLTGAAHLLDWSDSARWKRVVKQAILRAYFRRSSAALSLGTLNTAFYRHMGVPAKRIHLVRYGIDNDTFTPFAGHGPDGKKKLRRELGLRDEGALLLSVGRLTREKDYGTLLRAMKILSSRHPALSLVIVGTGPERKLLEGIIQSQSLTRVQLVGDIRSSAVPKFFGASDAFILSSISETWGVVINEALAAGLPVLASDRGAAARDLVCAGLNGFVFNHGDPADAARAVEQYLASDSSALGVSSRKTISAWDVKVTARRIEEAIWDTLVDLGDRS